MKPFVTALVVLCSLVLPSFACAGETSVQALSTWTNQSGSLLYIDSVASNGLISGTYINKASGYGCQNIPYPVTGWVYGSAMTFTTIWQGSTSCNSITAWTGFLGADDAIHTLWQLVVNGSSKTSQIIQGADTFTPVAGNHANALLIEKKAE